MPDRNPTCTTFKMQCERKNKLSYLILGRDGRTLQPHMDVSATRLHGGLDTILSK
jgi:hypothetical protein